VVPRATITTIVAKQHSQWWSEQLSALPGRNIIVQPVNRGTGLGILLSVLSVLEQDADARIVFLPSDHYVEKEYVLAAATRNALDLLRRFDRDIVMVGITPESADPELGYIVPGQHAFAGVFDVDRFVEKPQRSVAEKMLASRCFWNSFIFAAHAPALLGMIRRAQPDIVERMETALARDARLGARSIALEEVYTDLPSVDFSRSIIEGAERTLRVLTVPACGWSDLGTPRRVAEALKRFEPVERRDDAVRMPAFINLAAQHARLAIAG